MSSEAEKTRSLEFAIQEQHRDYDLLEELHESLRVRNITFLAAALAVLGFLYAGNSSANPLFIPHQLYGVIIYMAGLAMLLGSIGAMIYALVKGRPWLTAFDPELDTAMTATYLEYLEFVYVRYVTVAKNNGSVYERRNFIIRMAFLPMILGATILLVVKTFGG